MKKIFLRSASILVLIAFCIIIVPSWGLNCLDIAKATNRNELNIAPLRLFSDFAFILILPLGIIGLAASLLPSWLIRFSCAIGMVACVVMFAQFLLPHTWRVNSFSDPFYNTLWEKAKKQADGGSNYENIEYNPKNENQIIFYVKGFGISEPECLFVLFCAVPSAALGGEILLRKRKLNSTRQP